MHKLWISLLLPLLMGITWDGSTLSGVSVDVVTAGPTDYTLDANLVACWFMTDTDAAVIDDEINAHDLTLVSTKPTMSNTSTVPGTSYYHIEGNDAGYFTTADTDFLSSDFTVVSWFKSDDNNLMRGPMSSRESGQGIDAGTDEADHIQITINGGIEPSVSTFTDSTWYHVAYRYNDTELGGDLVANELAVFVSGANDCTGACSTIDGGDVDNPGSNIGVLANQDGANKAEVGAFYAETCYFDRALLETEICEICSTGIDGSVTTRNSSECGSCTLP